MRDYVDAKFKVIRPRRRSWISFNWRNFLILAGFAVIGFARWLIGYYQH